MTYNIIHWRGALTIIVTLFLLSHLNTPKQPDIPSAFNYFLNKAQQDTLSATTRKKLLKRAYHLLRHMPDDSLKYAKLKTIAEMSNAIKDTLLFPMVGKEALKLAEELGDLPLVGDAHWNYGIYYLTRKRYDSSYYHYHQAYKAFSKTGNQYYAGKMLFNMGYISSQVNEYTGAEIHLFQAIQLFEKINKYEQLYKSYNLLGTIADDMEEYTKAKYYYKKAEESIKKLTHPLYFQLELWNNIGVRYHKIQAYKTAIHYFSKSLAYKENLKSRPSLYAKLLDNMAFSKMALYGVQGVKGSMFKALALRDSIEDAPGSVISRIHLAVLYTQTGDTATAVKYAKQAYESAKKNKLKRDVLKALELLSILDKAHTTHYLRQHIALNKTLDDRERNLRNKFTAIKYETDKYIAENEKLFKERIVILVGAFAVFSILLLIYLNTRQRAKNRELLFEREQQQYNEDMFLLAMEQKTNLERGRSQERLRISEELHDGILARLFAVRFKWSFLELNGSSKNLKKHTESINTLTDIETEIRNISHDLRNELIWDELGFLSELEHTLKERSEIANLQFSFKCNNRQQWEHLDALVKINITRMVDEMVHNVIKHAHASHIAVSFISSETVFIFSVSDNGKGFPKYFAKKGIGLKNLKNRTRKLNGEMTLNTKVGQGTEIKIKFSSKT